jgi:hypothetical protein
MDAGYAVWTMAGYLLNLPPLQQPVTAGDYSLVGIPPSRQ